MSVNRLSCLLYSPTSRSSNREIRETTQPWRSVRELRAVQPLMWICYAAAWTQTNRGRRSISPSGGNASLEPSLGSEGGGDGGGGGGGVGVVWSHEPPRSYVTAPAVHARATAQRRGPPLGVRSPRRRCRPSGHVRKSSRVCSRSRPGARSVCCYTRLPNADGVPRSPRMCSVSTIAGGGGPPRFWMLSATALALHRSSWLSGSPIACEPRDSERRSRRCLPALSPAFDRGPGLGSTWSDTPSPDPRRLAAGNVAGSRAPCGSCRQPRGDGSPPRSPQSCRERRPCIAMENCSEPLKTSSASAPVGNGCWRRRCGGRASKSRLSPRSARCG